MELAPPANSLRPTSAVISSGSSARGKGRAASCDGPPRRRRQSARRGAPWHRPPKLGVAPTVLKACRARPRRGLPVVGLALGRAAADPMRLDHRRSAASADHAGLADQIELLQRGQSVEPEVTAKPPRVEGLADPLRQRALSEAWFSTETEAKGASLMPVPGRLDQRCRPGPALGVESGVSQSRKRRAALGFRVQGQIGRGRDDTGWITLSVHPCARTAIRLDGFAHPRRKLRQDHPAIRASPSLAARPSAGQAAAAGRCAGPHGPALRPRSP